MACYVVFSGFLTGLIVSWYMTGPRFSIASGSASLFSQLVDIIVFALLRGKICWKALLSATVIRSFFDKILFFFVAFSKTFSFIDIVTHQPDQSATAQTQLFKVSIPLWFSWAIGDFFVKIAIAFLAIVPYGTILIYAYSSISCMPQT